MKGGVGVDVTATCNSHDLDLCRLGHLVAPIPPYEMPRLKNKKRRHGLYRQLLLRTGQLATAANHLVS